LHTDITNSVQNVIRSAFVEQEITVNHNIKPEK